MATQKLYIYDITIIVSHTPECPWLKDYMKGKYKKCNETINTSLISYLIIIPSIV